MNTYEQNNDSSSINYTNEFESEHESDSSESNDIKITSIINYSSENWFKLADECIESIYKSDVADADPDCLDDDADADCLDVDAIDADATDATDIYNPFSGVPSFYGFDAVDGADGDNGDDGFYKTNDIEYRHCEKCIYNKDMNPIFKKKIIKLINRTNYDSITYANMLICDYFRKYFSIHDNCYEYIKKTSYNNESTIAIDKITYEPRTKEHYPLVDSDLLEFTKYPILSINFENYCKDDTNIDDSIIPDTTINNLLSGGKTIFLELYQYNGTLGNLPSNIKFLSVIYNSYYQNKIELDNTTDDTIDARNHLNIERIKSKNKLDILQYGNLMLHDGLEWLLLRNMKYVNIASLPQSLKGLILDKSTFIDNDDNYYRDFTDFPSMLEVLEITIYDYTTLICPDSLKVLVLNIDSYPVSYSEYNNIKIPDTLERLYFRGDIEYFDTFPTHLKTLDIYIHKNAYDYSSKLDEIRYYNLLEQKIPSDLNELIIQSYCDFNYNMDLLINIISKLKSLKLLIININEDEFMNDFEKTFREKLSTLVLNFEFIKIYFPVDASSGGTDAISCYSYYDNLMTIKNGYCECH